MGAFFLKLTGCGDFLAGNSSGSFDNSHAIH